MAFSGFSQQEDAIKLLQRSLARQRLGHAYLFSGDDLDHLELVARTLAKTLNCQQQRQSDLVPGAPDSCDECLSCRKIDGSNHPDVQWVRPESKSRVITIDQIRDLMQTIFLKPTEAEYKVAVIVGADRLNQQAANAFLKTLEEPPPRSILILLSTEPGRILETILSRCLRLNFAAAGERFQDEAFLTWLKQFSDTAVAERGSLLSRYRLLSVLLAKLSALKGQIEEELTARSPLEKYDDIDPKLREKWEDELTAAIEAEYRRQRADVLTGLEFWLRDVWMHAVGSADLLTFPALKPETASLASRINAPAASGNLHVLECLQGQLNSNVQEALALEVGLLQLKLG
jgi:DNA polymerase III subunit delta'